MKKIFAFLSLVAISLSVVSCDMLNDLKDRFFKKDKVEVEAEAEAEVVKPGKQYEVRVYSNAYDGFANVRQAPTLKSTVLGKLRNGDEYLVQLGVEGNWVLVNWHGMTGYVNKSVVGSTPWKPVYLNVDSNWLEGIYGDGYGCYLVFSNGKYAQVHQYGEMEYGVWKFEGNDIVFITKRVTDHGKSFDYRVGKVERYPVNVKNKMIGNARKCAYVSASDYEEYSTDANAYTKESFKEVRKRVNKLVKLKY